MEGEKSLFVITVADAQHWAEGLLMKNCKW